MLPQLPARALIWMLIGTFAGFAGGCGDSGLVPVSGQVLIDGKPVETGVVRFIPVEGRPALGELKPDGSFVLSTFSEGDGCPCGSYAVSVSAIEDVDPKTRRWHAPEKYADPKQSGLHAVINGPTQSLQLELTWGGKVGPYIEPLNGE